MYNFPLEIVLTIKVLLFRYKKLVLEKFSIKIVELSFSYSKIELKNKVLKKGFG